MDDVKTVMLSTFYNQNMRFHVPVISPYNMYSYVYNLTIFVYRTFNKIKFPIFTFDNRK